MSVKRRLYGIINARCVRHFLGRRIRRISPSLARLLQYGRIDLNTKKHWDKLWSLGVAQKVENERYMELTKKIIKFIKPQTKVLDIGCGTGRLMKLLRDQRQCDCLGADISEVAICIIKESGLKGYISKLPALHPEIIKMKFDVVTAVEVIEHLKRPDKTLNTLKTVIKPEGQLIISVPNDCMGPEVLDEHLHTFTETSIRALVEKYFEVERCIRVVSGSEEYLVVIARNSAR